ncbi:trans-sialidase, putative [Trypanosoma cruzi marinkellei]|uniref:Trans-sialidase, putative n=1 Tax=Trypanosoma cruzi marinkellei TaxID=85056 RepID=K2MEK0_TRYCR|nr:trans-sialidase, putative [Trypanosoma cruzi marinkellei]
MVAFIEGGMKAQYTADAQLDESFSDMVAEYIDFAWDCSALFDEFNKSTWRAHTVLGEADGEDCVGGLCRSTTTTKGNTVFFLVGGSDAHKASGGKWRGGSLNLKVVVGDATNSTGGKLSERIEWGDLTYLLNHIFSALQKGELRGLFASGGSGALMEDGTLVFSLRGRNDNGEFLSVITYSTDNGKNLDVLKGMPPAKRFDPASPNGRGDEFS